MKLCELSLRLKGPAGRVSRRVGEWALILICHLEAS